ncbi:MAG: aldehyde dehydrogenase family protein, partial [Pseudomonadota bacterium]
HLTPGAPLIAETGGLNAMIVDSTALPEQAVQAVIESAFQSAGQRCSALRCLYVQEDIAPHLTQMLMGAMDALHVGDPWYLLTDVGPVIDEEARSGIVAHVETARSAGRVLHDVAYPEDGVFVPPTLIKVDGIHALEREIFGPVLHLSTFKSNEIDQVIDAINATGYGLTFGMMTRIDDRVQHVTERVQAGNLYVNRNQIGAIVGSQPFGGEGLSGTGPKAGGPNYLARFSAHFATHSDEAWASEMSRKDLTAIIANASQNDAVLPEALSLPGPAGESNRLSRHPRAPLLCLGPGPSAVDQQATLVETLGGRAARVTGAVKPELLAELGEFGGVIWWGDPEQARAMGQALARRTGPILPLITGLPDTGHVLHERHVCVDTTAAGGNTALLGGIT